ncbi:hypothetical protein [Actinomadura nitritigenes]|uniref:hypothetical protein n=1 Tax=Actinomadura nitritigenes TaxID=134602 RepID=UPI003D8C7952
MIVRAAAWSKRQFSEHIPVVQILAGHAHPDGGIEVIAPQVPRIAPAVARSSRPTWHLLISFAIVSLRMRPRTAGRLRFCRSSC